jgi:hypothetical protein
MKSLSNKFVALAAVGVFCAALFGPTSEASATTWQYTMHTEDGDPGGRIRFNPYGDYVELCDIEPDGWAVSGQVSDSVNGYSLQVGGDGNCTTVNATAHDLKEEVYIAFRVCLIKSGRESYCDTSGWYNG